MDGLAEFGPIEPSVWSTLLVHSWCFTLFLLDGLLRVLSLVGACIIFSAWNAAREIKTNNLSELSEGRVWSDRSILCVCLQQTETFLCLLCVSTFSCTFILLSGTWAVLHFWYIFRHLFVLAMFLGFAFLSLLPELRWAVHPWDVSCPVHACSPSCWSSAVWLS